MTDQGQAPTPDVTPTQHARRLLWWGVGVTTMYTGVMLVYSWVEWNHMYDMKPQDFATFLSGVFAPLAFLWLVLGFRQQGDELQNSARALMLQSEELRASVEQQRQLVAVSREQMEFETRTRLAAETEAEKLAQPVLSIVGGLNSRSGLEFKGQFRLRSAGPNCIDIEIILSDGRRMRAPVLEQGAHLEIPLAYQQAEIIPLLIRVQYTDVSGRRREQQFHVGTTHESNWGVNFDSPIRLGGAIAVVDDPVADLDARDLMPG